MKVRAQIVVTIKPDNDVSAAIWIHDGNAPTFDEGTPISDNAVGLELPRHGGRAKILGSGGAM